MPSPTEPPAFPRHVVTAILVAHDGARWLPRVIAGILGQHRPPQRVVAVDTGSTDTSPRLLAEAFGEQNLVRRPRNTSFAAAVAYARNAAESYRADQYTAAEDPQDWLWILHDDSEPAPDALVHLLHVAEEFPTAVVIGPKALAFYDRQHLLDTGISVASDGRRWTGVEPKERDQGQHDVIRDVLAVSSAGMLVRRDVWDALGGFDRVFPLMREDVDFCWRVNAAGHQVIVAPGAVVYHAEAAARDRRPIDVGARRRHILDRSGAVFTALVHARGRVLPLVALRLAVESLIRAVGFLLAKMPGQASDELAALALVASRPDRVLVGRRRRARSAVRPADDFRHLFPGRRVALRHAVDTVTGMFFSQRAAETDATSGRHRVVELGPTSEEMESLEAENFARIRRWLRKPGLALVLGFIVLTVAAARGLTVAHRLYGGALLPAPQGASDLWSAFTAAWHPVGVGSSTPSPPYLAIVALVATVFFGHASVAVTVLLFGSVPLAGFCAYAVAGTLVPSRLIRVWGALAYAMLPALTGAIAAGRLGSAVAVALLPVLLRCGFRMVGAGKQPGTTRAAWAMALVLAVMTAFAPQAWLVAVVLALVWAGASLRPGARSRRVVAVRWLIVLAAPIVVLLPWSAWAFGHPAVLLSEAGLPGAGLADDRLAPVSALLLHPGGPGMFPAWTTAGILLAGLAALFRSTRRGLILGGWAVALVGFFATVTLSRVHIQPPGAITATPVWPGVPAALMGAGVIAAALIGAEGARTRVAASAFGWRQPAALLLAALAAVTPVILAGWWIVRGAGNPLHGGTPSVVPAYASEQAETAQHPASLVLSAGPDGTVAYSIVRDNGATLGATDVAPTGPQADALGAIVSTLLGGTGGTQAQQLSADGIAFVVALPDIQGQVGPTLDGTPGLTSVSVANGVGLWSIGYPAGRLTVWDPNGGAATVLSSGWTDATATVPAGPADRLLVLAESADSGWSATLDGQALSATTTGGWEQAFTLPATGGTVEVTYSTGGRWLWVSVEGVLALILLIMASPGGRREDDDEETIVDEAPASAGRTAARVTAATDAAPEAPVPPEPLPPESLPVSAPRPGPSEPTPAWKPPWVGAGPTAVIPAQAPEPASAAEALAAPGDAPWNATGSYGAGSYGAGSYGTAPYGTGAEGAEVHSPADPSGNQAYPPDLYGTGGYPDETSPPDRYDAGEHGTNEYPAGHGEDGPGRGTRRRV